MVSFQKQELPHAHILLALDSGGALHNCDDYDSILCV